MGTVLCPSFLPSPLPPFSPLTPFPTVILLQNSMVSLFLVLLHSLRSVSPLWCLPCPLFSLLRTSHLHQTPSLQHSVVSLPLRLTGKKNTTLRTASCPLCSWYSWSMVLSATEEDNSPSPRTECFSLALHPSTDCNLDALACCLRSSGRSQ